MRHLEEALHRTLKRVYPELVHSIETLMEDGLEPEEIIERMKRIHDLNDHQLQFITVSAHHLRRQNAEITWLAGIH